MSRELSILAKRLSPATLALSASLKLGENEQKILEDMQETRVTIKDGDAIIRNGDVLNKCYFIRSGWLGRQRSSVNGQMVTTNVYLPGDILSIHHGFARTALFDVVALQKTEVAVIEAKRLQQLAGSNQIVSALLDWHGVRTFNIISEHVVGMSTRPATERVLHLLLELWCRLLVVGKATQNAFEIPLSQKEIGEMVGISLVSANRSIQTLRRSNMITFENGRVQFNDVDDCMIFCDFDTDYLETFTPVGSGQLDFYRSPRP